MGGNPFMSMGAGSQMMPPSMGSGMQSPGFMGPGMMQGQGMMPSQRMMPGQLGPGQMPSGMMPGGPSPFGRVGITMEDVPNQRSLDERIVPPVPMPWGGAPTQLMPGQPTGIGPNNLNPMQQMQQQDMGGQAARLPNAYRMYGYGQREIFWSPQVPVPEPNTGIMINAEYPLQRGMEGREAVNYDYGIRNVNWQHQGAWVQPLDPRVDIADWKSKMYGGYEQAYDMKRPRFSKYAMDDHYKDLHKSRTAQGVLEKPASRNQRMQIMDDNELQEFWANPTGVMEDRLD